MRQKLLLVDDRPENLLVLEGTLENNSLEFVRANSGEEALKQLLRNDISIILLDVQMPGMDGFETAELIRGNPNTKHIPIIFVSAINKEKKHIFKGYASGAIDYIFKPFDPDILKSKVNVLLELDKQRRIVEDQNEKLISAKRNTDSILTNVSEGLFLLDHEYKISPQYSLVLEKILDRKDLAEVNFLTVLKGTIPNKVYNNFKEFIKICFDTSVDASNLNDLNPLSKVEYQPFAENSTIKYLFFDCRRVYKEEYIENLIFTVNDKTEKVLLEKKLAKVKKESDKQMDNLLSILHVDPKLLRDFIESLERDIEESKKIVRKIPSLKNKSKDLESVFRYMHKIKGSAAVLDLKIFMQKAHQAEGIITRMQETDIQTDEEIERLQQCLDSIQNRIDEINQLISKLNLIYKNFRPKRAYEIELLLRAMKTLTENLQDSTGKKVKLVYNNFNAVSIPYHCRLDLKDILVQLTRNAFYHGIETPQERKKLKKDPVGEISIKTEKNGKTIGFTFRDDGRGIDPEKLKNAALRSGRWKKEEIAMWDHKKAMQSIYTSGVTTMTKAGTGAGRGVGMDIIKQMINKLGGSIEIESEVGKYTQFKIHFPIAA